MEDVVRAAGAVESWCAAMGRLFDDLCTLNRDYAEEVLSEETQKMPQSFRRLGTAAAVVASIALLPMPLASEAQAPTSTLARTSSDGKPNLNGIWQTLNTAAWNIQDHAGQLGVPPGQGVVEGNEIPYQPWAAAKKKENFANRRTADPDAKCFLPGVPRATYMPFPFQIVQTPQYVTIMYEYAHARRIIYTDGTRHPEGALDFWMGDSRGRWEGDTLVVDVTNLNDQTWFDWAGNFHSEALHVVERYTPDGRDRIMYEATIEDPKVFTRPWKMSMPLYRRAEKNIRLLEYECVIYLQDERFKDYTSR